MKAAVISMGSKSSEWTAEAMRKYFDEVDMLKIKNIEINFSGEAAEVLYEGEQIKDYDCIYAKGSYKYAPLLTSITSILWEICYLPISPETFTIVHDKLLTQLELQKHGLPMPKTYLASTSTEAKKILNRINYPIIMKLPKGTHGKGVMFAETPTSAVSLLDALTALKQPFLIQEFIETRKKISKGGSDVRAFVVGDKVVAAMRRSGKGGEVRSNIHSGGDAEAVNLDAYSRKIAVKAAKAIGADIAGVDMLESVKGPMLVEVNSSPSVQGITKYTGIDVADKIAKYLFDRTSERLSTKKQREHVEIMSEIDTKSSSQQKFISNLDFRGMRILLPEIVTKLTGFEDTSDFEITAEKGKLVIKKFDLK